MDKKKNVTASAATGSSRSTPSVGSEAIKNLKTLIQLVDEVEELRRENEQLRHQLVAATEIIESLTARVKAAETRLLAAIREKAEKKMELAELKEKLGAIETADSHHGRWKKWLYPATATFLAFSAAVVICKSWR
ncbi:hypothetical protein KFK09_004614 [Dendrobium nobile]|uniref:Uncharacterized protein n=1 Tax=Dendrobium nobile TaxID=94219 RepID=A0A8T3C6K6_DENNO|nr:hypothetical protein KFK09_004614 [Dendrobium nobile]